MKHRAYIAPLSVALIWGVNVPVMKAGLGETHPFVFNAARLTLSGIALGIIWWLERRTMLAKGSIPPPIRWRTILWFGLMSSLLYQVLFLWGMDSTTASNTALIVASGPLWTALFSWLLRVERPSRGTLVSLGVAFAGTLLVTAAGARGGNAASVDAAAPAPLLGNLAILAAMMTWAFATVLSRPLLNTYSSTRLAYLSILVSLPGHWLLAVPHISSGPSPENPGFLAAALVYSGALSTGVAYALWNRSVVTLGPARTAAFSYLVPVVALAVAWWFLDDSPSIVQLAGGALVIAGLASRRSPRRVRNPDVKGENDAPLSSNRGQS